MNEEQYQQLLQMQKIEKLKETILRKILTKEARERLGRIKIVKPELATQLELYLVQLHQTGQLKTTIDDKHLKIILQNLTEKKKFRIIK